MRAVAVALWAVAAIVVLLPALRHRRLPNRTRDELVKDPVCQTYVARSRAVSRGRGGDVRFFCSAECARRYAGD